MEEPQRRQLTAEEIEVLQECGRESFWYRCVPLGLAGALATKYLIQKGILKPNPYYGSFPKISAALLVAYFAGKISYQGACNEKFLRLENSPIADMLRQKYGMGRAGQGRELGAWDYGIQAQYDREEPEKKLSDYYDTSAVLDTDATREIHELDDTYRPSVDNTVVQRTEESVREYVSYDELRRRNREAYEKSLTHPAPPPRGPGRLPPTPPPPAPVSPNIYSPPAPDSMARPPSGGPRRNKYGDIIE